MGIDWREEYQASDLPMAEEFVGMNIDGQTSRDQAGVDISHFTVVHNHPASIPCIGLHWVYDGGGEPFVRYIA